jgi:hypothetical protein
MSINLGIVDARVRQLATELKDEFAERLKIQNDENKANSAAFTLLVVQSTLRLRKEEALECLTEGGNDFGIDALHIASVEDGEFMVTLFQGKYKPVTAGENAFPQTGIEKATQAIKSIFDPRSTITTNDLLTAKIEDIRSLIRDGYIPVVCAVMCNNGERWDATAQQIIDNGGFPPDQVRWKHVNHEVLVKQMRSVQSIDDETLPLVGKAVVEGFNYCRVLIGKIRVKELAALFTRRGDLLLDRNIRRFLGLQGNRVNSAIRKTLSDPGERGNFYFYNNGITLLCRQFRHNELQREDFNVKINGLQIINGGQTCKTIEAALAELSGSDQTNLENAFVLIRIYELPDATDDLIGNITYNTNSQNPVDLRDLKSNDLRQRSIEIDVANLKGSSGEPFRYIRNRNDDSMGRQCILSSRAAEAILAVWRKSPQQARSQQRELFGNLYDLIFSDDLNGTQVVLATLLFRFAEKKRQRPEPDAPAWLTYGSHFISMLMGKYLLADLCQEHFIEGVITADDLAALDQQTLPPGVKQRFEQANPKLKARSTRVSVIVPAAKWRVSDENNSFLVEKLDARLKVMRECTLAGLNHQRFDEALETLERNDSVYYNRAIVELKGAIASLYGGQEVSLQQLAATFRRGDLLERLPV